MERMTEERILSLLERVKTIIGVMPYSKAYVSTLGGIHRASIMFTIGLDKPETWHYGYLENSRYMRFHVNTEYNGFEVASFVNSKIPYKLRKSTQKDDEAMIKKIEKIVADLLPLI